MATERNADLRVATGKFRSNTIPRLLKDPDHEMVGLRRYSVSKIGSATVELVEHPLLGIIAVGTVEPIRRAHSLTPSIAVFPGMNG